MAEQKNLNIWNVFKNEINKVFQELLSLEGELDFSEGKKELSDIDSVEWKTDHKHLKINISLSHGGNDTKMAIVYNSEVATSIEYYMLQGFSEKLGTIEASTLDANQEFTQTSLDNVKNGLVAAGLGEYIFKVENVEEIEDISSLNTEDMDSFLSYVWNQTAMEHTVSEQVLILLDGATENLLFPSGEKEEEQEDKQPTTDAAPESKERASSETYIVEIEDCDQRKTIFKEELDNLKLILNVELKLTVRIGTKLMLLKDIVNIDIGTTIELEQMASDPLDILINGVKIAEGEVVVVEGKFGIQIVKISSKIERLSKLKIKQ